VKKADKQRLFELADLIMALSRVISASKADADMYRAADGTEANWTPLESAVMRVIDRNPGTTARDAAAATQLVASNFSRALRGLEQKGFVRRDVDAHDARRVHLYPTKRAQNSLEQLRELWSSTLEGIFDDPAELDALNASLRRIEDVLVTQR
jgi:DNA-binding MarR family transcriptional regulator